MEDHMARSNSVENRLEKLEIDMALLKHNAVHVADILIDHSGRFDRLERRFDELEQKLDDARTSLEARLDRLIAITTDERTAHYERLQDLERRVSRLEDER
jgi:uncharacterized coiled-coil protein SlyX